MSKKIVIIESDSAFSQKLRADLEARGLSVLENTDGKASVDFVKREQPDLVVLAVELSSGQSGYIVCGKLKKDEELKRIPIIITGKDAEGFESHKRLKARAEDYLKKPFESSALIEKIGALIGLPEVDGADLVLDEDESLGLTSLAEDESLAAVPAEQTRGGDPDLDMLDAAFETLSDDGTRKSTESVLDEGLLEEPPPMGPDSEPMLELEEPRAAEAAEEIALDALEPIEEAPSRPPPPPIAAMRAARPLIAAFDDAELQALRAKASELESKARDLEDELTAKTNELEAVLSTAGGKDKEFFALREQANRKDKELLRFRQDLTDKEKELVELKDKEFLLDQKASELTTELAKRDAQIKTFSQRAETYSVERKKLDASIAQAKDESRQLAANLAAAQGELDQAQEVSAELNRDLLGSRADAQQTREELDRTRVELAAVQAEAAKLGPEIARSNQLEDEATGLRGRIAELEEACSKNEERVVKAYQKIKLDEKLREKTKKALAVALAMLEENPTPDGEFKVDDEATAS
jgi:CheY-like chemotaxis protein